jgi:hypothetical protein
LASPLVEIMIAPLVAALVGIIKVYRTRGDDRRAGASFAATPPVCSPRSRRNPPTLCEVPRSRNRREAILANGRGGISAAFHGTPHSAETFFA